MEFFMHLGMYSKIFIHIEKVLTVIIMGTSNKEM